MNGGKTMTTETTETPAADVPAGQLGAIVAWRVPNEVALATLRDELAAAGLDPELAGDLHVRHVLSRALRDMREGRVICKLRKVDTDTVAFQLTRQIPGAAAVDYLPETVITLNLATSAIGADVPELAEEARRLVLEHSQKRLTNDITRLVQSLFDAHKADLIPIREQGGVYFVPDRHGALVDKVRKFLAGIGGRLSSFAVKLGHGETSASVAESLTEYLTGLVAEFRQTCAELSSDTGAKIVERRHARIADLRGRLESYRALLGTLGDSVGANIDAAERELMARILQAPPPPAAESIAAMREKFGTSAPTSATSTSSSSVDAPPAAGGLDRFASGPHNQRALAL